VAQLRQVVRVLAAAPAQTDIDTAELLAGAAQVSASSPVPSPRADTFTF
jgi:hypothetical protein